MARRKVRKHSSHAYERTSERLGMTRKQTNAFARDACRLGKAPAQFPHGELREYLETKGRFKRLKVYQGVVVIMANTSNRLITAYPLPNEYMEEYKNYD